VSKRVRGPVSHRRPGARPPSERGATRRREPGTARPSQLEIADDLAEEIVEEGPTPERPAAERPAAERSTPALATPARAEVERATRTNARVHHKIKAGSLLAVRAATEYVYVSQDMRRIAIVASGLIALLFVLWLLIVVMRVIPLPFY
jgi:hypothetical protein